MCPGSQSHTMACEGARTCICLTTRSGSWSYRLGSRAVNTMHLFYFLITEKIGVLTNHYIS